MSCTPTFLEASTKIASLLIAPARRTVKRKPLGTDNNARGWLAGGGSRSQLSCQCLENAERRDERCLFYLSWFRPGWQFSHELSSTPYVIHIYRQAAYQKPVFLIVGGGGSENIDPSISQVPIFHHQSTLWYGLPIWVTKNPCRDDERILWRGTGLVCVFFNHPSLFTVCISTFSKLVEGSWWVSWSVFPLISFNNVLGLFPYMFAKKQDT
jgi:hypothetical protein